MPLRTPNSDHRTANSDAFDDWLEQPRSVVVVSRTLYVSRYMPLPSRWLTESPVNVTASAGA